MPEKINNQLTKGTAWLAFGNITSRILGAIYVIPWTIMLGSISLQANTLMGKGYNIYQFFLMLSTAGLPSAVAKLTAQLEDISRKKFIKKATNLSILAGFISSLLLWTLSPVLAIGDQNVIPVLHSLAFAVLLFPFLSVLRGQLQGQLRMSEIAISDIIEQVIRVVYMLSSTYYILYLQHGQWVSVVVQSTFAAFLGALFATIYLLISIKKNPIVSNIKNQAETNIDIKDIIQQALPFVIIGGFLSSYQWIDQYTFHPLMKLFYPYISNNQIEETFGIFNFNINKLVMIIVSLSVSIASTVLPLVTKFRYDSEKISKYIKQAYTLMTAVTLPACAVLYTLGKPIYIIFYGNYANDLEYMPMIQISCLVALFMGITTVMSMVLQGLNKTTIALRSIYIGLIAKMLLQPVFILLTGEIGAILATLGSLIIISIIMGKYINSRFLVANKIDKTMANHIYFSSILLIFAFNFCNFIIYKFVPTTRFSQAMYLAMTGCIGLIIIFIDYRRAHIWEVLRKQ
ncbi:polysaccharide biosynthesis protein [Leuconostoc pseudomesenteroides]|uniref:polysaccharide biosynthesis protein n=1 Tax=Leuconostoc pseudomesenteroides TaxID=33968 RepID=UPI0021A3432E|nr:polysaccharide biosynthesis protein [Leuconostoc pseudomesenteroides]MCT4413376.1 polysaccharide biosynthesis protein [Leuconostoc pseudomesenteroides]